MTADDKARAQRRRQRRALRVELGWRSWAGWSSENTGPAQWREDAIRARGRAR